MLLVSVWLNFRLLINDSESTSDFTTTRFHSSGVFKLPGRTLESEVKRLATEVGEIALEFIKAELTNIFDLGLWHDYLEL